MVTIQKLFTIQFLTKILIFKSKKKIKPELIYVRSLMTLYNPLMAVKILNQIKKRYSDAELLMIGSYDKSNYFKIKNMLKIIWITTLNTRACCRKMNGLESLGITIYI